MTAPRSNYLVQGSLATMKHGESDRKYKHPLTALTASPALTLDALSKSEAASWQARRLGAREVSFSGYCQLAKSEAHDGRRDDCQKVVDGFWASSANLPPCNEPGCELFSIE